MRMGALRARCTVSAAQDTLLPLQTAPKNRSVAQAALPPSSAGSAASRTVQGSVPAEPSAAANREPEDPAKSRSHPAWNKLSTQTGAREPSRKAPVQRRLLLGFLHQTPRTTRRGRALHPNGARQRYPLPEKPAKRTGEIFRQEKLCFGIVIFSGCHHTAYKGIGSALAQLEGQAHLAMMPGRSAPVFPGRHL